jgi:hypothetical protein
MNLDLHHLSFFLICFNEILQRNNIGNRASIDQGLSPQRFFVCFRTAIRERSSLDWYLR